MNEIQGGTLYLVPTPIGNLTDMSERALRVLREADIIAAEDTRHTKILLSHFGIGGKLISYHEHNKISAGIKLLEELKRGKSVAQCSDAGMPVISDPGGELVRAALDENIPVIPIPGPNAALTALVASGLDARQFTFVGFLPRTSHKKKEMLHSVACLSMTLIFYEAPHRLRKTLQILRAALGNRKGVLARELTKKFETFIRGTLDELIASADLESPRGEYVILLEGITSDTERTDIALPSWKEEALRLTKALPIKDAARNIAEKWNMARRDVYQFLLQEKERDSR